MPKLTSEQVRAEVQRFWNAFSSKSDLSEFYAHESSVFGSSAARAEPGRLAATRRQREYFSPSTTVKAHLGPVEVLVLGDTVAVASYTFKFSASKVANVLGGTTEENIQRGRATQVFAFDPDGNLRIVHEHLSTVDKQG